MIVWLQANGGTLENLAWAVLGWVSAAIALVIGLRYLFVLARSGIQMLLFDEEQRRLQIMKARRDEIDRQLK